MALMHSENLSDHDLYDKAASPVDSFQSEKDREYARMGLAFERKHREVLERFGRYPSRNACLGRQSTPEEIAFLKEGNGWSQ